MNRSKEAMKRHIEDRMIKIGVSAVMGTVMLAVFSCIMGLVFTSTAPKNAGHQWYQAAIFSFVFLVVGFCLVESIRFIVFFLVASLQKEKWGEVLGFTPDKKESMDGHYGIVRDEKDKHPYNTGCIHLTGHEQVWKPGVMMPYFTIGNRCYVNIFHRYTA